VTIKTTFDVLRRRFHGRILIESWGDGVLAKSLAFTPLAEPVPSAMKCSDCGCSEWNASNFSNLIHFCPGKTYDVFVSDYRAVGGDGAR
jgi:hypothetical protein